MPVGEADAAPGHQWNGCWRNGQAIVSNHHNRYLDNLIQIEVIFDVSEWVARCGSQGGRSSRARSAACHRVRIASNPRDRRTTPVADAASKGETEMIKLALVIGHTEQRQGAFGVSPIGENEYPWNKDLAQMMAAHLEDMDDVEAKSFFRDDVGAGKGPGGGCGQRPEKHRCRGHLDRDRKLAERSRRPRHRIREAGVGTLGEWSIRGAHLKAGRLGLDPRGRRRGFCPYGVSGLNPIQRGRVLFHRNSAPITRRQGGVAGRFYCGARRIRSNRCATSPRIGISEGSASAIVRFSSTRGRLRMTAS